MHPNQRDTSSMTESDTLTMATRLVYGEKARSHLDFHGALRAVARRLGLSPGSLENLVRGRAKRITVSVAAAVRGAMIRELEGEIARLTHELELVRACGADPRSLQITEIEALLAKAERLLSEGASPT